MPSNMKFLRLALPLPFLCQAAILVLFYAHPIASAPQCSTVAEEQTFLPDARSCSTYHECVDGRLEEYQCPRGMQFDQSELRCVPTIEADCDFTVEKAREILKGTSPKVYLGFDDGPGHGSKDVVAALNKNNVQGTFFVNAVNMDPRLGARYAAANREALVAIVDDGHALGDHSYNHMKHNNKAADGSNGYKDFDVDVRNFGRAHSNFVKGELVKAGVAKNRAAKVAAQMNKIVRLPFTNGWRVTMNNGRQNIVADCAECTTPESSGRISTEIMDALHNGRDKANVYGWDIQFDMEVFKNVAGITEEKVAQRMLAQLMDVQSKDDDKIVVLAHDREFAPPRGGSVNMRVALERFIAMAKQAGFVFRKLSDYPSDY